MQKSHLLTRQLQVRFSDAGFSRLREFSQMRGLSLAGAIRLLVDAAAQNPSSDDRGTMALAALVASEHALQLLQAIVPEGNRRYAELAPKAVAAAEARLRQVGRHSGEGFA